MLVGYFEGIESERGIEWRCTDSLSLRRFLRVGDTERVPDHSTLSRMRQRLAEEVFSEVFDVVLAAGGAARFVARHSAERAIAWVARLLEPRFVGTESRLLTVFQLLTDMIEGSEANPDARLAELQKRRDEIDSEMGRLRTGQVDLMDPAALRERFQLMASTARELLADFRELEQSFHQLDRGVRQRIAAWDGGRGALLDSILGERDAIASSDQGTSFRAFWDFLMSTERQEEFTQKLQRVFELPAIAETVPDPRLRRIHYDWLSAGRPDRRLRQ